MDTLMLAISRRPNETIVFPELDITVKITRVAGSTVRLGVTAPREVTILRGELVQEEVACVLSAPEERKRQHDRRNALSKLTLGLHLARRQSQAGLFEQGEATLTAALETLESLEQECFRQTMRTKPREIAPR